MTQRVPVDSARLRAAVADERYWRPDHPEQAAWRAWVTEGFQAIYGDGTKPATGIVHVRAYVRNGQTVAAHTRSAPPSGGGEESGTRRTPAPRGDGPAEPEPGRGGWQGLVPPRRSLLDDALFVPAMARRPKDGVPGNSRNLPLEGGGGGGGASRAPGAGGGPRAAAPRAISPRSQELVDILAPNRQPIGARRSGTKPPFRTMPGGQPAAEAMFRRLTEGRVAEDITRPSHVGRVYRLDDGSVIGYRPFSSSSGPAIDVNIPGFELVRKLHY